MKNRGQTRKDRRHSVIVRTRILTRPWTLHHHVENWQTVPRGPASQHMEALVAE